MPARGRKQEMQLGKEANIAVGRAAAGTECRPTFHRASTPAGSASVAIRISRIACRSAARQVGEVLARVLAAQHLPQPPQDVIACTARRQGVEASRIDQVAARVA